MRSARRTIKSPPEAASNVCVPATPSWNTSCSCRTLNRRDGSFTNDLRSASSCGQVPAGTGISGSLRGQAVGSARCREQVGTAAEAAEQISILLKPLKRFVVIFHAFALRIRAERAADIGPSSQSSPSQCKSSRICLARWGLERWVSISSIRKIKVPSALRICSQDSRAVQALPMCSSPEGVGANRPRARRGFWLNVIVSFKNALRTFYSKQAWISSR